MRPQHLPQRQKIPRTQFKTLSRHRCYVSQAKELLPGHAPFAQACWQILLSLVGHRWGVKSETAHVQYRPMGGGEILLATWFVVEAETRRRSSCYDLGGGRIPK